MRIKSVKFVKNIPKMCLNLIGRFFMMILSFSLKPWNKQWIFRDLLSSIRLWPCRLCLYGLKKDEQRLNREYMRSLWQLGLSFGGLGSLWVRLAILSTVAGERMIWGPRAKLFDCIYSTYLSWMGTLPKAMGIISSTKFQTSQKE